MRFLSGGSIFGLSCWPWTLRSPEKIIYARVFWSRSFLRSKIILQQPIKLFLVLRIITRVRAKISRPSWNWTGDRSFFRRCALGKFHIRISAWSSIDQAVAFFFLVFSLLWALMLSWHRFLHYRFLAWYCTSWLVWVWSFFQCWVRHSACDSCGNFFVNILKNTKKKNF